MFVFDLDKDYVLLYYCDLVVVLVFGMIVKDIMLFVFVKVEDLNFGGC